PYSTIQGPLKYRLIFLPSGCTKCVLSHISGLPECARARGTYFSGSMIALETNHWFGPEDIAGLTKAFEAALGKLGLVDRSDLTTVTLAKLNSEAMNAEKRHQQPVQFQTARQCGARTRRGRPCRSPATKKDRCRLHGGASGSGGPPGERNGQYRHGERTRLRLRSGRNSGHC